MKLCAISLAFGPGTPEGAGNNNYIYLQLAGNEEMEKNMETTRMANIGTTINKGPFFHS